MNSLSPVPAGSNGPKIIYPQRTNNILEQFFRGFRRGYCLETSNNTINGVFEAMLADTPLVKNLDNHDYMELLLDGKENLEELFAELDEIDMEETDGLGAETERILAGFGYQLKPGQKVNSMGYF